jgi:hypothetical protein
MESSNVDEIKIICSRFSHSRCNERHGNNQRQRFWTEIQAAGAVEAVAVAVVGRLY